LSVVSANGLLSLKRFSAKKNACPSSSIFMPVQEENGMAYKVEIRMICTARGMLDNPKGFGGGSDHAIPQYPDKARAILWLFQSGNPKKAWLSPGGLQVQITRNENGNISHLFGRHYLSGDAAGMVNRTATG
jgi:hypothetical protein